MSRKRKAELEPEAIAESWSRTEQYKVRGRHQWTIDDFLRRASCTEVGDSLCSPVFSVPVVETLGGKRQDLTFQLEVFPNGEEGEDNCDYVAVFLTSRRQEDLEVKYDFSVLKADGAGWSRIGNTFKKFSPDQNSWGYGKAFSKAKLIEKQMDLLPGGRLTIVCNLEIYHSDRQTVGKKPKLEPSTVIETPSLSDNMVTAFGNPDYADVSVVCGAKSFPCHKVILAARSDVFAAMFSHKGTTEAQTSKVEIEDTDPDTLEQLLRFIYTDQVDCDMSVLATSLMRAADKYNIPRLKMLCEEAVGNSIDVTNAADALVLAHLHEATNLKLIAVDFVTNHLNKVAETTGWTTITEGHPKVLSDILKSVMARMKS